MAALLCVCVCWLGLSHVSTAMFVPQFELLHLLLHSDISWSAVSLHVSHREKVQRLKFSSSLIVMNLYFDLILNCLTVTTSELRFPKSIAVRNVQSGSFRFCCHAANDRAKFIGIKCIFVVSCLLVPQLLLYTEINSKSIHKYLNMWF